MVDVHTEIEQKFDVAATYVLPALDAAVAGVADIETETFRLEAIYFDTADLRLAHRKITLRRRTGGTDQGWHLKLPVGKGVRTEFHEAYTDELIVPDELRSLVTATTRGAALSPVARLVNLRTAHRLRDESGRVVLEVADDHVTGETLGDSPSSSSWREVEVELVEGERRQLAKLAKLLVQAGAEPSASGSKLARTLGVTGKAPALDLKAEDTTAGELVLAYLRRQQAALTATDPAVRLGRADGVHKMRVASRRFRSALKSFEPLFTGKAHVALEDGLGRLAQVLGRQRDAEVSLARMREALDALPADLVMGTVRDDVVSWLGRTHDEARAQARAYLDKAGYVRLLDQIEAFLADPPLAPAAAELARTKAATLVDATIAKVAAKGTSALATKAGPARVESLHDARRAAKRSRYAADVYALNDPKPAKAVSVRMEALQETLGDWHDGAVMAGLVRDFATRTAAAGGNGFTYGFLLAREESRGATAEQDFAAALELLLPLSPT